MTKLRILADNLHDQATLTASSELLSVNYTQRSSRSYRWRSADREDQTITAAMANAQYVDCFALARHNLGAYDSVRFQFFLNGQESYDSGFVNHLLLVPAGVWKAGIDPWGQAYNDRLPTEASLMTNWLSEPVIADSYRITIRTSKTDKSGVFEIARIFVGLAVSPAFNYDWKANVDWVESLQHRETEAGSLRTVGRGHKRRAVSIQLSWLSEADRQVLLTNLAKVGLGADLLVSLFPNVGGLKELEHSMICRRDSSFSHTHVRHDTWQTNLSFREV